MTHAGVGSNQYVSRRAAQRGAGRSFTADVAAAVHIQPAGLSFDDLTAEVQESVIQRERERFDSDDIGEAAATAVRFSCFPERLSGSDIGYDSDSRPACWWSGTCDLEDLDVDYMADDLTEAWTLGVTAMTFQGSRLSDWVLRSDDKGIRLTPTGDTRDKVIPVLVSRLTSADVGSDDPYDRAVHAEFVLDEPDEDDAPERTDQACADAIAGFAEINQVVATLWKRTSETFLADVETMYSDEGVRDYLNANEVVFDADGDRIDS